MRVLKPSLIHLGRAKLPSPYVANTMRQPKCPGTLPTIRPCSGCERGLTAGPVLGYICRVQPLNIIGAVGVGWRCVSESNEMRDGLKLVDRATLSLLSVLEDDGHATQRSLAVRIGVALGLTNSLLKRALQKGLVKVQDVPARRFAYYVTPKGFSEKSRLVAEYLTSSLIFFRQARDEYTNLYKQAQARGHKRIVLYGMGELAEIAILSAQEAQAELCGMVHLGSNQENFSGLPVYGSLEAALADQIDAVVITTVDAPQAAYDQLMKHIGAERVFAAPMLHVSRSGARGRE